MAEERRCPRCKAGEYYSSAMYEDYGAVSEFRCGSKFQDAGNFCQSNRCRIRELEQQLEMKNDPMIVDEARWLDERNAGAGSLAQAILADNGIGVIIPGPCADLLKAWREMKQQLATATVAERERCAKICEHVEANLSPFENKTNALLRAADEIRKGTE